jgi:pimeloyl-ACP methyl ester carboxylesterase
MNTSGFVPSNGAQIHYTTAGRGQALVLLHGNGEDAGYFAQQVPFFSPYYRVIAIDSRAHGRSTRGHGPLDFAVMASDVVAVLDALNITQAHVLGFSDGGNIALQLALTQPERLLSLTLVGANLHPAGMTRGTRLLVMANYVRLSAQAIFSPKARQGKEVWALMVFHPQWQVQDIAHLQVPTMVIAGEKDMIKASHTRAIARAIENARLYIILQADHFVAYKKPEVFNPLVAKFLAEIKGTGRRSRP